VDLDRIEACERIKWERQMQEQGKVAATDESGGGMVFSMEDEVMEMKGPQLMSKPPTATSMSGDEVMEEALRRAGVVARRDERGGEVFFASNHTL
jgi:hypothetical protein